MWPRKNASNQAYMELIEMRNAELESLRTENAALKEQVAECRRMLEREGHHLARIVNDQRAELEKVKAERDLFSRTIAMLDKQLSEAAKSSASTPDA